MKPLIDLFNKALVIDLRPPAQQSWRATALNAREIEDWNWRFRWSNGWRYALFAGLRFNAKNSDGSRTLVSRHWPHRLCWSWSLRYASDVKDFRTMRRRWFLLHILREFRVAELVVAGHALHLSWQDYGYMGTKGCPKPIWAHQVRHFFAEREEARPHATTD